MRFQTDVPNIWIGPAMLGVMLIGFGVLILVMPQILNYIVAGFFVVAGCSMFGVAWSMRRQTSFRQIDPDWQRDEFDGPR